MRVYVSGTSILRSRSAVSSDRYCCPVHKAVVGSRATWSDSEVFLGVCRRLDPQHPFQPRFVLVRCFFPSPVGCSDLSERDAVPGHLPKAMESVSPGAFLVPCLRVGAHHPLPRGAETQVARVQGGCPLGEESCTVSIHTPK